MTEHTNVVVIGGGYAGVMAANRLTQRDDVAVTLINARDTFVERIRLHQLVAGSDDAVVDYRRVLADAVRLRVGTATRINAAQRSVTLGDGKRIDYDYLVYAVGSDNALPRVPGAADFAYGLGDLEQAQRLRQVVNAAAVSAPITIVGAGPTGMETAAELAEAGRRVTLVCGKELGPYLHAAGRRSATKRLSKLGVTMLEGPGATVTEVSRDAVRLSDGRTLPSAITVWTAGFGVPPLAADSGLRTDAAGRLLTDETLTSLDDERIVAAGDSAAPSDLPLRMSCQAAGPLGGHAADTVLRKIAGERATPIEVAFVGQCISLGRRAGLVQLAHRDDVAAKGHVGGGAAAVIKELVCWGTVQQLAWEARKPGSYFWLKTPKRQELVNAEAGISPNAAEQLG